MERQIIARSSRGVPVQASVKLAEWTDYLEVPSRCFSRTSRARRCSSTACRSATEVVTEHCRLLEEAIESNGGLVVDRRAESFFAVFPRMRDAAAAACAAQTSIAAHEWPDGAQVKVRMGIHAGDPELEATIRRTCSGARHRIGATAHGGQVIMSGTARGLLDGRFSTRSLGSYPLKDFDAPEPLYQLQADGLAERFPRPRVTPRRSHRTLILIGAAIIALIVAAVAAVIVSRSGAGAGSLRRGQQRRCDRPGDEQGRRPCSGRQSARPCRLRGRVGLGREHRRPKPDSARRLQAHERGPGHARQPNTDRDQHGEACGSLTACSEASPRSIPSSGR